MTLRLKTKTIFCCQTCGYQSPKWIGKCPDCGSWNSFTEELFETGVSKSKEKSIFKEGSILLKDIKQEQDPRIKTDISEFDLVLGGGIVKGSVVLIGGDPGIGKSTLSLQVSNQVSKSGHTVLYVSGEESVKQTKLRADRLGVANPEKLYLINQIEIAAILEAVKKINPDVVIIDSIQVVYHSDLSSSPGSVSQVRECASLLTNLAKATGISIFLIGHVTKEGTLAGPRVLEHIVDTVLYFEGDRYSTYRILRAVKNRFGSTNEIGVFEMGQSGLKEVANLSKIFLSEKPKDSSGTTVVCVMEGTRPLLVEIQALVSRAEFGYARRRAQGVDYNRLSLLVAVLEKRIGLNLASEDIFINVAGGVKVADPAADLGIIAVVASSFKNKVIPDDLVILGEVGLVSEVRSISQANLRINEAAKLGFKRCILPLTTVKNLSNHNNKIELFGVSNVKEALDVIFK